MVLSMLILDELFFVTVHHIVCHQALAIDNHALVDRILINCGAEIFSLTFINNRSLKFNYLSNGLVLN